MSASEIIEKCREVADGKYVCRITATPLNPDAKLQNIGYRAFVAQLILDITDTDRLTLRNLPDGKNVEVCFVGDPAEIGKVISGLESAEKKARVSLANATYLPKRIERYSLMLVVEQLSKGIDAQFKVIEKLSAIDAKLDKLDTIDGKLDSVDKKLDKLDKLEGIENTLKDIRENGIKIRTS